MALMALKELAALARLLHPGDDDRLIDVEMQADGSLLVGPPSSPTWIMTEDGQHLVDKRFGLSSGPAPSDPSMTIEQMVAVLKTAPVEDASTAPEVPAESTPLATTEGV